MGVPNRQIGWSNESNLLWQLSRQLDKLTGIAATNLSAIIADLATKITNEQGVPSFYADTLANIPAAGTVGRMFVATDTFALYRDNGTGWDLIGGPGIGTVTGSGTATQVAFWNGASVITGSSNLYWDNVTNSLGIGTSTPAHSIDTTGDARIQTIANATVDTDRFLVSDAGVVKYRTGAEMLGDLGVIIQEGAGTLSSVRINASNTASGNYSTAFGQCNTAAGPNSFVGGGFKNNASFCYGSVVGGLCNTAECHSFVGGGCCNQSLGNASAIVGGECNYIEKQGSIWNYSVIGGGYRNKICIPTSAFNFRCYSNVIAGGQNNSIINGRLNIIGGGDGNIITGGGTGPAAGNGKSLIAGGSQNTVSGYYGIVSGGTQNTSSSYSSTISGGYRITASGCYSTVGNGRSNIASGCHSKIGSGRINTASGNFANILGGQCNQAAGQYSVLVGGCKNLNNAVGGFIGSGICNNVCNATDGCLAIGAVVVGGVGNNTTGGTWALATCTFTVAPTIVNAGCYSFIGGGFQNRAMPDFAVIGGGRCNVSTRNQVQRYTTIAGGNQNTTSSYGSSVLGGHSNTASNLYSTVGGGFTNTASGTYSFVGSGYGLLSSGYASFTGSGYLNTASGRFSGVASGCKNLAQAQMGFIGAGICNILCNSTSACCAIGAVIVGGVGNGTFGGTWSLPSCVFTVNPTSCNTGDYSFVGGGFQNIASGSRSGVLGGTCNNTCGFADAMIIGSCLNATQACTTFVNCLSAANLTVGNAVCVGANKVLVGYTPAISTFDYANFSQSQTLTATAQFTEYLVEMDTTNSSSAGITRVGTPATQITFANAGTYRIMVTAVLLESGGSGAMVSVWFKKNGNNIANSNTDIEVPNNQDMVVSLEWIETVTAGQYIEIAWSSDQNGTNMAAKGTQTTPTRPATPSVIVTVNRVA